PAAPPGPGPPATPRPAGMPPPAANGYSLEVAPVPLTLSQVLEQLRTDPAWVAGIQAWEVEPAQPGRFAPPPPALDGPLVHWLRRRGIDRLYSHQAEAVAASLAGDDVVVVTPTASGKTLCYTLPVLQRMLERPSSR